MEDQTITVLDSGDQEPECSATVHDLTVKAPRSLKERLGSVTSSLYRVLLKGRVSKVYLWLACVFITLVYGFIFYVTMTQRKSVYTYCENGWSFRNNQCYRLLSSIPDGSKAKATCGQYDAELAHTVDQIETIQSMCGAWIGLMYNSSINNYTLLDGTSAETEVLESLDDLRTPFERSGLVTAGAMKKREQQYLNPVVCFKGRA